MKGFIFLSLCVCLGCMSGCKTTEPKKSSRLPAVPKLKTNYQTISKNASEVKASVDLLSADIGKEAERINTAVLHSSISNEAAVVTITNAAHNIQAQADQLYEKSLKLTSIIIASAKNEKEMEAIKVFLKESEVIEDELDRRNKEIANLNDSATKAHKTMWLWISGFGAIAVVAGVVMIFLKMVKLGVGLIAAGLCLSSLAFFMAKYAAYIAIFGGLIFLIVIYIMIRMVHVKNRALSESVLSTELLKEKVDWDSVKEEVGKVQSKRSKDIIWKVRETEVNR